MTKFAVSLLLSVCGIQSVISKTVTTSLIAAVLRQSDKNVIFSPLLLTDSLLKMQLAAGSKTAHEMSKVLQLNNETTEPIFEDTSGYQESINATESLPMHMASRLFLSSDVNLLSEYQQLVDITQSVNFAKSSDTFAIINEWIAEVSNGTITKLVERVDAATRALLLSVIYFKGLWKYGFDGNHTRKSNFYIPQSTGETRQVEVDMMFRKGLYRLDSIDKLEAMSLEIPFDSLQLSMVILLPKAVDGIDQIIKHLDQMDIDEISPKTNEMYVQVYLPKFKFDIELSLNEALNSLDLVKIANSSVLTEADFKIDKILQKSVIEIDEEGSTEVAPQDLGFSYLRFPLEFVMRVDHPFVLLIKNDDKIYLAGRVSMEY